MQEKIGSADYPDIEAALSYERLARYLAWAHGNRVEAIRLYALNTSISEAFYTPLQMLEVALRNRCHTVLSDVYGADWFDRPGVILSLFQGLSARKAKLDLIAGLPAAARVNSDVVKWLSPGRVVASLTFGFWTAFFGNDYEGLWRSCLSRAVSAPPEKMTRKILDRELTPTRLFRNRIAHHEPILYLDLAKRHHSILQVTEWLLPTAARWSRENERASALLARHRETLDAVRARHNEMKKLSVAAGPA
jgi:hypothetical protein